MSVMASDAVYSGCLRGCSNQLSTCRSAGMHARVYVVVVVALYSMSLNWVNPRQGPSMDGSLSLQGHMLAVSSFLCVGPFSPFFSSLLSPVHTVHTVLILPIYLLGEKTYRKKLKDPAG